MLYFSLFPSAGNLRDYTDDLAAVAEEPACCDELRQVVDLAFDDVRHTVLTAQGALAAAPLRVHAHYSRRRPSRLSDRPLSIGSRAVSGVASCISRIRTWMLSS